MSYRAVLKNPFEGWIFILLGVGWQLQTEIYRAEEHQFHFLNNSGLFSFLPAAVTQDEEGPAVYLKSYPEEDPFLSDLEPLNADSF